MVAIILSVVAIIISVVGWFITYRLSDKSNKEGLRRSLLNEARQSISSSIRSYIEWCSDVLNRFEGLIDRSANGRRHDDVEVTELCKRLQLDRRAFDWLQELEENEPLIPATVDVRIQLLQQNHTLIDDIMSTINGGDLQAMNKKQYRDRLMDMISLGWDLRVYVQNQCLGELTGHHVMARDFKNPTGPVIVVGQNGQLEISGAQ